MAKNGKSSGLGLIVLAVVVCVAAAGATYYFLGGFQKRRHKPVTIKPPVITLLSESKNVTLYLPKETPGGIYLAPTIKSIEVKGNVLDAALMALLATNKEQGMLASLIPQGTKLLDPIKIDKRVAQVNLSREFVDNFSGGSDQEALTLNSVVATVVNNSEGKARKVQIVIEGKNVESLGGHYDLTKPLSVDQVVLKPEVGG
jgi:germination protein M